MKYKEGDVLVDYHGNKSKILGVCGLVYFKSYDNDFTECSSCGYTQEELDNDGYTLFTEPEEKVLTMNEVAKLAGVSVDKLKIIKE